MSRHPKDLCSCGEPKDARSNQCATCRKAAYVATCHPDRKHFAKGMCERCYANEYQRGDRIRGYQLKFYFGLTSERYEAMLHAQGGRCAICECQDPGGRGSWHVDHNHACCPGKRSCGRCVRALLCRACNHLLGNSKEDVAILEAAIRYIKDH